MLKEGFIMAWHSLLANKLRTLLTMLGIIIGVGAVIALVSIGLGVRAQVQSNLSSLGSNLLMVYPGAPKTPGARAAAGTTTSLKVEDFEAISKLKGVEASAPIIRKSYSVVYQHNNWTTNVQGVSPSFQSTDNWSTSEGQFISDMQVERRERVAVIGATVAKNLFADEDPIGKNIRVKNQPFKVIGVLASKGSGSFGNDQDDLVIIPYTTMMERLSGQTYLNMIYILGDENEDLTMLQADIENLLRLRHKISANADPDFTISNMETIMETVEKTTTTLTLFLGAIAAISLVVGGIGIMNIMLVSVTERTREIGIRKALGATYRTIVTQFLIEAVVISLIGGFIGIIVGIGAAQLISAVSTMKTVISVPTIILSFGFSMAIGLVFGIYPARKAAKLNPIDALHYE